MNKFKTLLSAALDFTKSHGVTVLRGVAIIFAGRKAGHIARHSAEVLDKVLDETKKK